MGRIKKTEYGTFRAFYYENGKEHGKTFKTKALATTFLKGVEGDIVRGEYFDAERGKITFRAWSEQCLEEAYTLRQSSIETDERSLAHLLPILGDKAINCIDNEDIAKYLTIKLRTLKPATVSRHYKTLKWMMLKAVQRGRIRTNPCNKDTPGPKVPRTEMHFLDMGQLIALADELPERWGAWALVKGTCGPRWGEMIGLRRKRVDILRRKMEITHQRTWNRKTKMYEDGPPKSDFGLRTITIPAPVCDRLAAHIGKFTDDDPDAMVFTNSVGKTPAGSSFTSQIFKLALVRAGLPRAVRIHDLRHTAAALAIKAKAHPKAIQARMGHSSITVTLDTYGHLYPEVDEELAVDLGNMFTTTLSNGLIVSTSAIENVA